MVLHSTVSRLALIAVSGSLLGLSAFLAGPAGGLEVTGSEGSAGSARSAGSASSAGSWAGPSSGESFEVEETEEAISIRTPLLSADIRKRGYVSGVAGGTFVDRQTGFRDAGFGLDVVDWLMEPGSDAAYRDRLPADLVYRFDTPYHGRRPKRCIEGPQICTKAGELQPKVVQGNDFLAVQSSYRYHLAAPERKTGSTWTQTIIFPAGKRYFISCDRIDAVNESPSMFLRIDMPGHIKHERGDTFSEIYLSYLAETNDRAGYEETIPAEAFFEDFAPDVKFNYRRDRGQALPERFIRAYRLRDPQSGAAGPWLAGMTLQPSVVHEAWCHQRGYVCMIQEFGGRPIKPGQSFSAAFVVGFFDSIEEMHAVYDEHKGRTGIVLEGDTWRWSD